MEEFLKKVDKSDEKQNQQEEPTTIHRTNRWLQIKKVTVEVLQNSTSHGIPNIFRNGKSSLKIMWTIFLLASSVVCGGMVYANITSYLSYDVITKIKVIQQIPIPFPMVSEQIILNKPNRPSLELSCFF